MLSAGRSRHRLSAGDIINQVSLNRRDLIEHVKPYGFVETSCILRFLENVCGPNPDECAFLYIRGKLDECLRKHDNGSEYFSAMRRLLRDLDYLLFQSECFIAGRTRSTL